MLVTEVFLLTECHVNRFIYPLLSPLLLLTASLFALTSRALEPDFFASNSVLAEGKWVKVKSTSTGMQLIPAATLRAMGFTDISKVNVYGIGGRMLPEYLDETISDDLPLLPCVRNDKGIIFFGTDVISWQPGYDVPFTHTQNPYDTESWYFLSDRDIEPLQMQHVAAPTQEQETITSFTERLVHESELAGPAESGRTLFGEDFRSQKSRTFSFLLPGVSGDSITMKYRFGAKSSVQSSILVSANGKRLPASNFDIIRESLPADEFLRNATSVKGIHDLDEKIDIELTFSSTGNVTFARLDYIEMFYERPLRLDNGSIYFYTSSKESQGAAIDGCSSAVRIWDVTVPWAPKEMDYRLDGSKAIIAIEPGYHEYIAFEPDRIAKTASEWEQVANQNIHAMLAPDMVIITFDTYREGAERIARLHEEHDGMTVAILRPEDIYNEFSGGSAEVTAFKRLLKMWYDREGEGSIRYCLLMGRPHFDNRCLTQEAKNLGYRPMPIWQEPNLFTDGGSYSTDSYIAMVDDSKQGYSMSSARQRVAVGRLPVKTAEEANNMAIKIEKYVKNPGYGAWRNKIMFIADDIDEASMADTKLDKVNPKTFFDQSENIYEIIKSSKEGERYIYDRVYLDASKLEYTSVGRTYPSAKAKMLANFNDGIAFVNYLGHASPRSWSHEKLLEWTDIISFSNRNLPFIFGGTCEFAKWDANSVSGGEEMVLNPAAGCIAMVMPSRTVYITQNYQLNRAMAPYLLMDNEKGEHARIGDFFRRGMNDLADSNKLRYCLIGDPALTFPRPVNIVGIETIGGKPNSDDPDTFPVIPALGKIELTGNVLNSAGETDEDFNGVLELILFDAEKVVETKNLGKGLDRTYNDRKTRLTTTSVRVENGRWAARLMLPAEIDNNYSPALISAYAWNENTGEEAHGMTENLYVYGYDDESEADTKAPDIEKFYLNNPNFSDGMVVNANPVVFATLFDESGINVSDAGIGHKMILTLDGDKIFTDLNTYFTADPARQGAGSLCYPLEGLEPGKHTLKLSVWDNANNSAVSEIEFNVGAAVDPTIVDLSTDVNPASTSVVFAVTIDRPNSSVSCLIEVFDLMGRTVWTHSQTASTDINSLLNASWDLRDKSGVRVPRGIYLYRATVRTPEGTYTSQSRKLAVTAQ